MMSTAQTFLPRTMVHGPHSISLKDLVYFVLHGILFLHEVQSSSPDLNRDNDHHNNNNKNSSSIDYILKTKHSHKNKPHHNRDQGAYNHTSIKYQEWYKELYPNPQTDHRRCGRRKPSYVCDPAFILSREDKLVLDDQIRTTCRDTNCPCPGNCSTTCQGFLISVAIVPKMALNFGELITASVDSELQVQDWAEYLRDKKWHFGNCANQLLIVLSVHDKKVFTSTGEEAKAKISAVCSNSVYHDAKRNLKTGHYGRALAQMVEDYRDVLNNEFKCVLEWSDVMPTGIIIAIIFGSVCLPLILCVVLVFLGPCCRGRGRGPTSHKSTYNHYRYHQQPDLDMAADPAFAGHM